MVVVSAAPVSDVPHAHAAILQNPAAVLYDHSHVGQIFLIFTPLCIEPLVEVGRSPKYMIHRHSLRENQDGVLLSGIATEQPMVSENVEVSDLSDRCFIELRNGILIRSVV